MVLWGLGETISTVLSSDFTTLYVTHTHTRPSAD